MPRGLYACHVVMSGVSCSSYKKNDVNFAAHQAPSIHCTLKVASCVDKIDNFWWVMVTIRSSQVPEQTSLPLSSG